VHPAPGGLVSVDLELRTSGSGSAGRLICYAAFVEGESLPERADCVAADGPSPPQLFLPLPDDEGRYYVRSVLVDGARLLRPMALSFQGPWGLLCLEHEPRMPQTPETRRQEALAVCATVCARVNDTAYFDHCKALLTARWGRELLIRLATSERATFLVDVGGGAGATGQLTGGSIPARGQRDSVAEGVAFTFMFASRNDAYMGNATERLFTSLTALVELIGTYHLADQSEVVVVDWNSPSPLSEHPLAARLRLARPSGLPVRFLLVPPDLAAMHAPHVKLSEVHAYNAAVRRARGAKAR
jgi:hypothetical protein